MYGGSFIFIYIYLLIKFALVLRGSSFVGSGAGGRRGGDGPGPVHGWWGLTGTYIFIYLQFIPLSAHCTYHDERAFYLRCMYSMCGTYGIHSTSPQFELIMLSKESSEVIRIMQKLWKSRNTIKNNICFHCLPSRKGTFSKSTPAGGRL